MMPRLKIQPGMCVCILSGTSQPRHLDTGIMVVELADNQVYVVVKPQPDPCMQDIGDSQG